MTVIFFRCSRLVYHLSFALFLLTFTYVEDSIKTVYCDKCETALSRYFSQLFSWRKGNLLRATQVSISHD